MSIKKSAWKNAVVFFFTMLAASLIWNLVGRPKESVVEIFSIAAIGALLMYALKLFSG
jgi:hypothetical protein